MSSDAKLKLASSENVYFCLVLFVCLSFQCVGVKIALKKKIKK